MLNVEKNLCKKKKFYLEYGFDRRYKFGSRRNFQRCQANEQP